MTLLALALALMSTVTADADSLDRERLRRGHVVYVSFARPPKPDARAPGYRPPVPTPALEATATAVLDAEVARWQKVVDWFRAGKHRYRALRSLLATTAAPGRRADARVVIVLPAPADALPAGDLIPPAHSGLSLIAPRARLGDHADVVQQKLAHDFAHAVLQAPPALRATLHELVPSIPDDERALELAIDDERKGWYFLGSIHAAVAFADHPTVIERLAALPLTGDEAQTFRAIVGRAVVALRDGAAYPDDIYPALIRLSAPAARRLIEWLTLSVPDGQFESQREPLATAADAYAARGAGSNLGLLTWGLGKSRRVR